MTKCIVYISQIPLFARAFLKLANAYKTRKLYFRGYLLIFILEFLLVCLLLITGNDLTIALFPLFFVAISFLIDFYCSKHNLGFLPGPKRDILVEFTNIIKQDVLLSGFKDNTLKGFRYDYDINSINLIRGQLRIDIAGHGWKSIRRKFTNSVRDIFGTQWYAENCFLLKILDLEEYLGYEGSILDILKGIKSCTRLEELEKQITSQLIPKLQDQIESGGNTTFLDIDKMKEEESARLVPIILEKRKEQFLSAMDTYRVSGREVDDLLDVLGTNYGCKVATAIKKDLGVPKAAGYIVTQLNSVYESLIENKRDGEIYTSAKRSTRWIRLCKEIAMSHITHLIEVKSKVPFQCCNPNFSTLYDSGYQDIFKDLRNVKSYPKLYRDEYKFILNILKGIKTERAFNTLQLLKHKQWKDEYLQN